MDGKDERLRFKAQGITCRACASDMETVLNNKDGITSATVDYDTETVDVRFDPSALDKKDIFSAVRKLVFKLDVLKD